MELEERIYYLYKHLDKDDNIFYIGKGTKNAPNLSSGYSRAYSKTGRTQNWKIRAENGYLVEILQESNNEHDILLEENKLILECDDCINRQTNKIFNDYKIVKISNELCVLNIFQKAYLIFPNGIIINSFGKILKSFNNGRDYLSITFSEGEYKRKNLYVHRLIAESFVENPDNKKVVNHKDLNSLNNNSENLEWVTSKENVQYSLKRGSYKCEYKIKPLYQINFKGKIIRRWNRASEAATFLKCTKELIQQAASQINIKCLTGKGFIWIYVEDYNNGNIDKMNLAIIRNKL